MQNDCKLYAEIIGGIYRTIYDEDKNGLVEAIKNSELMAEATKKVDSLLENKFHNIDIFTEKDILYINSPVLDELWKDKDDATIIHLASSGCVEAIKWYVDDFSMAEVNCFLAESILAAIKKGHIDVIDYFITNHREVHKDMRSQFIYTACNHGQLEVIKYLSEKLSIKVQNLIGRAVEEACLGGHIHILKWLLESFEIKFNERFKTAFYNLHVGKRYEMAKYLHDKFPEVIIPSKYGRITENPLCATLFNGNIAHAHWLLEVAYGAIELEEDDHLLFRQICETYNHKNENKRNALKFMIQYYRETDEDERIAIIRIFKQCKKYGYREAALVLLANYPSLRTYLEDQIKLRKTLLEECNLYM